MEEIKLPEFRFKREEIKDKLDNRAAFPFLSNRPLIHPPSVMDLDEMYQFGIDSYEIKPSEEQVSHAYVFLCEAGVAGYCSDDLSFDKRSELKKFKLVHHLTQASELTDTATYDAMKSYIEYNWLKPTKERLILEKFELLKKFIREKPKETDMFVFKTGEIVYTDKEWFSMGTRVLHERKVDNVWLVGIHRGPNYSFSHFWKHIRAYDYIEGEKDSIILGDYTLFSNCLERGMKTALVQKSSDVVSFYCRAMEDAKISLIDIYAPGHGKNLSYDALDEVADKISLILSKEGHLPIKEEDATKQILKQKNIVVPEVLWEVHRILDREMGKKGRVKIDFDDQYKRLRRR